MCCVHYDISIQLLPVLVGSIGVVGQLYWINAKTNCIWFLHRILASKRESSFPYLEDLNMKTKHDV